MANPFSKSHNPETSIKRNVFDLSHRNHLSFNFGDIVPIACVDVMNGDTVDVDLTAALRFMPTYFPVQNKIRADIHAFYVRSRNLYKDFKQFMTNQLPAGESHKPPYLSWSGGVNFDERSKMFKDGGLADYMGVPTRVYGSPGTVRDFSVQSQSQLQSSGVFSPITSSIILYPTDFDIPIDRASEYPEGRLLGLIRSDILSDESVSFTNQFGWQSFYFYQPVILPDAVLGSTIRLYGSDFVDNFQLSQLLNDGIDPSLTNVVLQPFLFHDEKGVIYVGKPFDLTSVGSGVYNFNSYSELVVPFEPNSLSLGFRVSVYVPEGSSIVDTTFDLNVFLKDTPDSFFNSQGVEPTRNLRVSYPYGYDYNPADRGFTLNPWNPDNPGGVPISPLPFRAYESCYNAYFRDDRNNPLLINNQPVYDTYCRSTDGGADTLSYNLYKRNWEQDPFTTALPSPQQGNAPLVGIVNATTAYVTDPDTGKVYQASMSESEDGKNLDVKFLEVNQDTTVMPNAIARSLVSQATSGISINDFRNVNALQRFLELNMMRGRKYKDIIEARWGVNISYAELDMPEFIGGTSFYIDSFQINQTSEDSSGSPLGSYAGQLSALGKSGHKIHHYCDEQGYLLIVCSVVPVPVYTQHLPPMFTRMELLDYYQPEFGHIGYQAIPNKFVAPLQYALFNPNENNSTFGYQRAWWDYMFHPDVAHGQFRNSLKDFLMYRQFGGLPKLSPEFLLVDSDTVDDVFSVQKDADGNSVDKILGYFEIDLKMKRPIPLYGTPRLEA